MTLIRRLILAFTLMAGLSPALAQAPAPVPGLPDSERRTSYTISGTTCACNVNFALYGDSTDYQNWVEVFLNGTRVNYNDATLGWTITSPSGSLASLARPITDAVLTFNSSQTGTVQIVGARRPRRVSQFSENRGVAARDLNQALTDIISQNREIWDKTNDVTGRMLLGLPGENIVPFPSAAARASSFMCWDATGLIPGACAPLTGSGNVNGPNSATSGNLPSFNGTTGRLLQDSGLAASKVVAPTPTRAGDIIYWNGAAWITLAGNNSGSNCLLENSSGVPSWIPCSGATQLPQGRLTLTSGTPITTTDVTGATAIYYTPYQGRYVPIWNGSSYASTDIGGELSVTLGSNWLTNTPYDWFVGLNSSTPTLCSGPAWTSSTARGSGAGTTQLNFQNGINVNAVSMTCNTSNSTSFTCAANACTYVGSTLTVAAGQLEDSLVKRFLYNAYNQQRRPMLRQEPAASWTYSTASYHQANANTANQLAYFAGLAGSSIHAMATCIPLNSTSTLRIVYCGIGIDSTSVNSRSLNDFARIADATVPSVNLRAFYEGFASLGSHTVVWLEKGNGTDTQTWFGVSGSDYQTGISGNISQ